MAKSSSRTEMFDTLVIGGGLSGLLIANRLQATGRDVAIIEAGVALGGGCRPFQTPFGSIDHGLKFFPATEKGHELLQWVSEQLSVDLGIQAIEATPVTFDNGRLQPFVGFGAEKIEAQSELGYYIAQSHLQLTITPADWITRAAALFSGEVLLQSHLTKITIENGKITEAIVNGTKRLTAHEYVFCAPPALLARLLTDENLASRQRQKMAKGPYWSAVHLDLLHSVPVTDYEAIHVLKGANEEPCIGIFHPSKVGTNGEPFYHSQWMTFIRADFTEDDELTATALKKIKRQLKRAYPTSLDNLVFERILICDANHGESGVALNAERQLAKISNLWISSGFFAAERNILGALNECRELSKVLEGTSEHNISAATEQSISSVDASL